METAPHTGYAHTSDARTARTVRAEIGNVGTIGRGRTAVGYAWCARENAYHIAPAWSRMGPMGRGYTNHLPWDMNGRRYATRAENTTHTARIGAHRGTYTTLERVDANNTARARVGWIRAN